MRKIPGLRAGCPVCPGPCPALSGDEGNPAIESRHYRARVSTSVVLAVTPKQPIDPDRYMGEVPADVAAALVAAGQAGSGWPLA